MIIFIMRHGEAEPMQLKDEERKLTSLGKKQSHQSGIWIKQSCEELNITLDLALVSPYVRTQETVAELAKEVVINRTDTCSDIIPSSDPDFTLSYLDTLIDPQSGLQGLLLVSHMPFVSYFLDHICQHHFSMLFSAGSIAVVRYSPGQGPANLVGQFLPE